MRNAISNKKMIVRMIILISISLFFGCKQEMVIERSVKYGANIIHRKYFYSDKRDTLNYSQLDYYPSGELLSKTFFKDGMAEGRYEEFYKNGNFTVKANLDNGRIEGIYQEFDTIGRLASESYYIEGTRVLYSECEISRDGKHNRQLFYAIKEDSAFLIGSLVKVDDSVHKDLSRYALIEGDDTIKTSNYDFSLNIYKSSAPKAKYEITLGRPNLKLEFTKIDTTFITSESEILINTKLNSGINHIFGRIIVYDVDSIAGSASYYVYKDVFVNAGK